MLDLRGRMEQITQVVQPPARSDPDYLMTRCVARGRQQPHPVHDLSFALDEPDEARAGCGREAGLDRVPP